MRRYREIHLYLLSGYGQWETAVRFQAGSKVVSESNLIQWGRPLLRGMINNMMGRRIIYTSESKKRLLTLLTMLCLYIWTKGINEASKCNP